MTETGTMIDLGVCYYPEQWPRELWERDARHMRELGLRVVRIGEFAWSRIEPRSGELCWDWLDEALDTLHRHDLRVVLGTPTATPPKWLVDAHPDILAVDEHGHARGFGSRRHYCFSSPVYREQSARMVTLMAERYGRHPAVCAWQTDNEYGCHSTVLSYSRAARERFRVWLQRRYGTLQALNRAWGTVFWSQEYTDFAQIDPPAGTVTEANPSHRLDWRRFASDEVAEFNRLQVDILRRHSPGRDVLHNFMGFFTEFDHHRLARDLDVATWDSYPLGATQNFFLDADEKRRHAFTGHPDIPAFHHDLYRGMCGGRWWVMEQQPGPVNWAQWNPAPHPGMVRAWTWQALAHGAEIVSYFRWRQAPYAQEQMHAGLQRPDGSDDLGAIEAAQVARELDALREPLRAARTRRRAQAALVFDYASLWMADIQPQGRDYLALEACFRAYSALRQLGLDVDILAPQAALDGYALVVLPAQLRGDAALAENLRRSRAQVLLGPRAGSKTEDLQIPDGLAPGVFAQLAGVQVQRVSSLPPGVEPELRLGEDGPTLRATRWCEQLALRGAQVQARLGDEFGGGAALTRMDDCWYLGAWLDQAGWVALIEHIAAAAGLDLQRLPEGLRISRVGELAVALNFSDSPVCWEPPQGEATRLLGARELPPRGLSIWKLLPAASPH
jgi:beta-galactosidase